MTTTSTQTIFHTVTLRGGPMDGQCFRVRRGSGLSLPTRRKRFRGDHRPLADYRPGPPGVLIYNCTYGEDPEVEPEIVRMGGVQPRPRGTPPTPAPRPPASPTGQPGQAAGQPEATP